MGTSVPAVIEALKAFAPAFDTVFPARAEVMLESAFWFDVVAPDVAPLAMAVKLAFVAAAAAAAAVAVAFAACWLVYLSCRYAFDVVLHGVYVTPSVPWLEHPLPEFAFRHCMGEPSTT